MTLPEGLVVVAVLGITAGIGAGPLREGLARARLASAAREIGQRMILARWNAVANGRSVGLRFEPEGSGWRVASYLDGDGDGIRTGDIRDGRDTALGRPFRPADGRGGVRFGVPPGRYPRVPPSRGWVEGGEDPIRFGRSDIASFSPMGSATAGTVYLTDGDGRMAAVVVFGTSARVRVVRFDTAARRWR